MKIIVVLLALTTIPFILPVLVSKLPGARRLALAITILALVTVFDVNLANHAYYRGMSRSFDVGTVDIWLMCLIVFHVIQVRVSGFRWISPNRPGLVGPIVGITPGLPLYGLFLLIAALSILGSKVPLFGWMDFSKLFRGVLLMWAVANLVRDDKLAESIPIFLLLFVLPQDLVAAKQHLQGVYWVPGTFTHKNSFAMSMNLILPVILAHALNGRRFRWTSLVIYGGGCIAVILSRSRTGWVMMAFGAALVIVVSVGFALVRKNRRLLRYQGFVLLLMAVASLPVLAVSADGIIGRMDEDRVASMNFRDINNEIADKLAEDHFLGVGLNNYVRELKEPVAAKLQVLDHTVVHHAYKLVAAELGYIGLFAWMMAMAGLWVIGLATVRNAKKNGTRIVSVGILVGMATGQIHSLMESDILRRETYFIFMTLAGLLVAMNQREGLGGIPGTFRRFRSKFRWIADHVSGKHPGKLAPRLSARGPYEPKADPGTPSYH